MENTSILISILKAIYWEKFTINQQTVILNIVNDSKLCTTSKASEICEFLGIEKRDNRSAIISVLS